MSSIESSPFFPLLPLGLFVVVFPMLWCFVTFLLSRVGGWARLAERYGTGIEMPTTEHSFEYARMGIVNYRGMLLVAFDEGSMWLDVLPVFRVGHRRLRIPLKDISEQSRGSFFGFGFARLRIADVLEMKLRDRVWDERPGAPTPQEQP